MLEKPEISEDEIQHILQSQYAVATERVEFLPLGNDATAWVYRVYAPGGEDRDYFLKLKKGSFSRASLEIPRFLREQGMEAIVAPLASVSGDYARSTNGLAFVLYPWITGQTGMTAGLNRQQWVEFGKILHQLHSFPSDPPICTDLPQETFVPPWAATVREITTCHILRPGEDAICQALAEFWRERQDEIARIVERCEILGQIMRDQQPSLVLCHSDIHTANLLIDPQGMLHLIDWDTPLYAPRERDLMFIFEKETVSSPEEQYFLEGYGKMALDPTALAYYRYEWVVQEMGDYGKRCFSTTEHGENRSLSTITRMDALRGFKQLFDRGDVVDEAYQADGRLKMD